MHGQWTVDRGLWSIYPHKTTIFLTYWKRSGLSRYIQMDYLQKIRIDFELHSVEGIRECFQNGVSPNEILNGKPLIYELISMYTRGPLFKNCIQAFVDFGLEFEDEILLSVLLDNAVLLDSQLASIKLL